MKRFITVLAAVLLLQTVTLNAQDQGDEPTVKSVLDAARAKYRHAMRKAAEAIAKSDEERATADAEAPASEEPTAEKDPPYAPLLLSFVPGVSVPFGYCDASVAAGCIGTIARDINGASGSGIFNIERNIRGAQGAGIFNLAGEVRGAQGAGIFNIADSARGIQGAGLFNISGGKSAGVQGAGLFNISQELQGIQGAGLFNIAGSVKVQGAGLFNIADRVQGLQAAGMFNSAKDVKGLQIGVVNVARHIDGAQIGLFNFAGNGISGLGLTFEPRTGFGYAYWQAGTPYLYTIARVGAPFSNWEPDWRGAVASYGLGTRGELLGAAIDLDLSAEAAVGSLPYSTIDWDGKRCEEWEGWSMIRPYPSLRVAASLPLGHHWMITGGVKVDFDVEAWGERVPEALKAGEGGSFELFGQGFTAWPKWFFGLTL